MDEELEVLTIDDEKLASLSPEQRAKVEELVAWFNGMQERVGHVNQVIGALYSSLYGVPMMDDYLSCLKVQEDKIQFGDESQESLDNMTLCIEIYKAGISIMKTTSDLLTTIKAHQEKYPEGLVDAGMSTIPVDKPVRH